MVIIEKHSNVIKTLRDEVLTRIHYQSDCLPSLKSRSLKEENATVFITSTIEREEELLKQIINLFHAEVATIQKDLQIKLVNTCDRLEVASKTYAELNDDFHIKLSKQRKAMMTMWKANYVKKFQQNRMNFLKNLVIQVHFQINDRMMDKENEFNCLLAEKKLLNDKVIKLEKKRIQIMKKQKELQSKIFFEEHKECL
ncbi:unnamed protein product [Auanema sp. JU1783]|nr:unnamed protein product [Auanema sp. JU1783]